MALTLDGIDLGADVDLGGEQLEWTDEFAWSVVEQSQERSLSGALIVQEGVKLYGRPITLASNDGAWFRRSVVQQLETLRDEAGRVMLLELPSGAQHYVIFNRVDGNPLDAAALFRRVAPSGDALYQITLRLITVAPPAEIDT